MKPLRIWASVVVVVALGGWWWSRSAGGPAAGAEATVAKQPAVQPGSKAVPGEAAGTTAPAPQEPAPAPGAGELSAAEKVVRVARIKQDYEEITKRFAGEFTAAGKDFPGGVSAYLRQLALMEREKWKDIGAVLSPRELEDLQMVDLRSGRLVQQWLGDTAATEEQRRAVFRLQKDFDDRFALTFDTAPAALYEREQQRHEMLEAVARVLGEAELFPAWMRNEGADYAKVMTFVGTRGLPPATAYALWDIRHEFTAGRLKILMQPGLPPAQVRAQQEALAAQVRLRLQSVIGIDGVQAGAEVFNWLPAN